MIDQKKLDKAAKALLAMNNEFPHECPPKPTKKDLERKFKMKIDSKGKPVIEEVS